MSRHTGPVDREKHLRNCTEATRIALAEDRENMTEEQVNALVEFQSRPENLPVWWYDDFEITDRALAAYNTNSYKPKKSKKR